MNWDEPTQAGRAMSVQAPGGQGEKITYDTVIVTYSNRRPPVRPKDTAQYKAAVVPPPDPGREHLNPNFSFLSNLRVTSPQHHNSQADIVATWLVNNAPHTTLCTYMRL